MTLRYISTRGETRPVSFDQAVLKGQATDGGLYIPVFIPSQANLFSDPVSSIAELAERVFPHWIGRKVVKQLVEDAFSIEIPVIDLGANSRAYEGMFVVELFHGPTGSFKDFGARFLANWMTQELREPRHGRVVLVATSGDTGSAVADGFSGLDNTSVVVLYPHEGVSPYQRRQLTMKRPGVSALAVRGSFDDCQGAVKEAFRDPQLSHLELTSANSINVGRLLPQMLFYLWAAQQVDCSDPMFVVPSGNLGNLCAGLMAAQSALPDARFVAATNHNRYFVDYLADPEAEIPKVVPSLSNAMDVAVPSNLERMRHLFGRSLLLELVQGHDVSDAETIATMKRVWHETGYVADPHTAVGLRAAMQMSDRGDRQILVMGTASPDKYRELVNETLGRSEGAFEEEATVVERIIDPGLQTLRRVILDTVERNTNA